MEEIRRELAAGRARLLALPNVVGIGIGLKEVGGRATARRSVTVLVRRKVPAAILGRRNLVPRALGEVPTDVIEVGDLRLLDERRQRLRPACPGISVGHYLITAGTLGMLVRDAKTGEPLFLSNNHVLANTTNGRDGRAAVGDPIYQPGPYDRGGEEDLLGRLARFVPLWREEDTPDCPIATRAAAWANRLLRRLAPGYRVHLRRLSPRGNTVDAAVGRPLDPALLSADILGLGAPQGIADPVPGMRVAKSGRTSGVTTGEVRAVEATVRVSLGDAGYGRFEDQVVLTPMAQPGDSGSIILADMRAVALLSAGSELATIAGRIGNVFRLLDITL